MDSGILDKKVLGLSGREIIFLAIFYFIFSFGYHFTLTLNINGIREGLSRVFSVRLFIDSAGLDYLIKLLLTIPIWWLIFKKLKHWKLSHRLLIHLVALPVFIYAFMNIYYRLSEYFGFFHLTGSGKVWDVYIPILFYFVQFGIFHTYEYYQNNQRNIKLKAELSKAALKSELVALKAQLNPHFLYNTFNTISASVPSELENTREMIAKLSDLFRYQLKGSKQEYVPLRDEIDFVKTYLQLEKERFEERLNYQFDIDPQAFDRLVPPMILQPLVENAIKHGISPKIEGGQVLVNVQINSNETIFEVCDDGMGMSDEVKGEGIGLANTKLRLEKMYGEPLHIESKPGEGVCIKFKIPVHAESSYN